MGKPIIGVFDSGVGGLTVLRELAVHLPECSYIYFADNANAPYGPKGPEEIIRHSHTITDFLIQNGCSLIVVACNTATAAAIDYLRENFSVPFVGMEPAIKPAALNTKTKSIGILATKGTFEGRLYQETSAKYATNVSTHYTIGDGLVELVENGEADSAEMTALLKKYIDPMVQKGIDHLVLGCSHYPFFIPTLQKLLPKNVSIINPAGAVAKQTARLISSTPHHAQDGNPSKPFTKFYASGTTTILKKLIAEIEEDAKATFHHKTFTENVKLS